MDGFECRGSGHGMDGGDDTFTSVLASEGIEFLLSGEGTVPLSSLDQVTACLFFSANWCRPCRVFTPQLVQVYNTLKDMGKKLQIIFISFDRDENGFREHFKCMPWLALPFDISTARRLCARYDVAHIPGLIPLHSDGKTIEEDAIPLVEDYGVDAYPFTNERREQLKAMDDAKRRGGTLKDLLVCGERDYVVSGDGGAKVPISELIGKTVGFYFGGLWCPPCRIFTLQLIEAYNELKTTQNGNFQIIFVSTDRDQEEFNQNISTMPWLTIPYNDRTRHDLCRIFDIKGIPTLVLVGPDGKAISANGRAMIASYGAKAYPFTESRIIQLEEALQKEGEGLLHEVYDPKHNHVLKLDMAKAYVCDSCKRPGRFWVFSCDICDFDLHPACVKGT